MPARKLLVADDSLTIQKVIRLALSNASGDGHEIQAVSDGNDAIQQISLFRPDVVLIDVSLPSKNAFEVKESIQEHLDLQDTRFILMSSAFESYDEALADRVGFHGKLSKPFDPAHLRQVLDDAMASLLAKKQEKTKTIVTPPPAPPQRQAAPEVQESFTPAQAESWESELEPIQPEMPEMEVASSQEFQDFQDLREFKESKPSPDSWLADMPPPASAPDSPDADIRSLTESTIRLSGLEDSEWSVDDSAKKISTPPPMRQASVIQDPGYTEIGESTLTRLKRQMPEVPPLDGFRELAGATLRPGAAAMSTPQYEPETESASESEIHLDHLEPTLGFENSSIASEMVSDLGSLGVGLSSDQLEEAIRKQVQEMLSQMARQVIPEIAERVIKQEISRLLQEGP